MPDRILFLQDECVLSVCHVSKQVKSGSTAYTAVILYRHNVEEETDSESGAYHRSAGRQENARKR